MRQVKNGIALKTRTLRFRVDPELARDLRWAARQRGVDVSTYLRRLAEHDIGKLKKRTRR